MKWAVFSDVHGNLPALETFIHATSEWADRYLCLGDIVNYGPWNNECVEMVFSLPGIVVLEGNHERLFSGAEPISAEPSLVQEFFKHSFPGFRRKDLISNLRREVEIGGFRCAHSWGCRRLYPDSSERPPGNWLIGHSHHAFKIVDGLSQIVNVGSIGQNRANICTLTYAMFDDQSGNVDLHESPYPLDALLNEMKKRGYSQACLNYYYGKLATAGKLP